MPDTSETARDASVSSHTGGSSHGGLWIVAFLVVTLLILHQDNWFWTDGRLVFGFMPIGLVWHAGISIAASVTWFIATKIAWPVEPQFEAKVTKTSASKNEVSK